MAPAMAAVTLIAALVYSPAAHRAWAAPPQAVPDVSVMVPAGGTAYLQVKGLSLRPNESIPSGPLALATPALAPDLLRTTLYYGIDWGYSESDPRQVALAVWWAQDHVWYAEDHATAERIANAAASSPGTPSWNPGGRSLLTLVAQGQMNVGELALTASSQLPAMGTGTLALHNSGQQDYLVYLPYGTVFTSASGSVIVWAVSTGNTPATPQATPTAQQEETPAASPTSTPTPASAPTATPTISYKQGAEPTPEQSPSPSYKAPPSPATLTPTDTPQAEPTATSAPPASTPTPTSTPTPERTGAAQSPPGGAQANGQQHGPVPVEQANAAGDRTTTKPGDPGMPADRQNAANVSVPPLPSTPNVNSTPGAASPSPTRTGQAPAMPSPVGTSASNPGAGIPPAQATTQATVVMPAPAPTGASRLPTPTGGTIKPTPTPSSSSLGGLASDSSAATQTALAENGASKGTTTPAPTPVPQPLPTASGKEPETPVIIVNPEDQKAQTPISPPLQGNPAGGTNTQGPQGSPPQNTPVTGGGPSTLPMWLALVGVLLVAGGWGLRRASHHSRTA